MSLLNTTSRSKTNSNTRRVVLPDVELDEKFSELQAAHKEQSFHIKRSETLLPTLKKAEETMTSQESIITNIEDQIKENLKTRDKAEDYEREINLQNYTQEREILKQKNAQLDTLFKMNEGILPKELVNQLSKDPLLRYDPVELQHLKQQANDLLGQIEHLSQRLEDVNIFNDVSDKVRENDAMNT